MKSIVAEDIRSELITFRDWFDILASQNDRSCEAAPRSPNCYGKDCDRRSYKGTTKAAPSEFQFLGLQEERLGSLSVFVAIHGDDCTGPMVLDVESTSQITQTIGSKRYKGEGTYTEIEHLGIGRRPDGRLYTSYLAETIAIFACNGEIPASNKTKLDFTENREATLADMHSAMGDARLTIINSSLLPERESLSGR